MRQRIVLITGNQWGILTHCIMQLLKLRQPLTALNRPDGIKWTQMNVIEIRAPHTEKKDWGKERDGKTERWIGKEREI